MSGITVRIATQCRLALIRATRSVSRSPTALGLILVTIGIAPIAATIRSWTDSA